MDPPCKRPCDSNDADVSKPKVSKVENSEKTMREILVDSNENPSTTSSLEFGNSTSTPTLQIADVPFESSDDLVEDKEDTSNDGNDSTSNVVDSLKACDSEDKITDNTTNDAGISHGKISQISDTNANAETISISSGSAAPSPRTDELYDPIMCLSTCAICKEPFQEKQPLLLPCLHSFCSHCVLKPESFRMRSEEGGNVADSVCAFMLLNTLSTWWIYLIRPV